MNFFSKIQSLLKQKFHIKKAEDLYTAEKQAKINKPIKKTSGTDIKPTIKKLNVPKTKSRATNHRYKGTDIPEKASKSEPKEPEKSEPKEHEFGFGYEEEPEEDEQVDYNPWEEEPLETWAGSDIHYESTDGKWFTDFDEYRAYQDKLDREQLERERAAYNEGTIRFNNWINVLDNMGEKMPHLTDFLRERFMSEYESTGNDFINHLKDFEDDFLPTLLGIIYHYIESERFPGTHVFEDLLSVIMMGEIPSTADIEDLQNIVEQDMMILATK